MSLLLTCSLLIWVAALWLAYKRANCAIDFPLLFVLAYGGYVLPQMISADSSGLFDYNTVALYTLSANLIIFCVLIVYGSHVDFKDRIVVATIKPTQIKTRLLCLGYLYLTIGFFASTRIQGMSEQLAAMGGQWTGVVTIWAFFGNLTGVGFALLLFCFPPHKSWIAWPGIAYGLFVFYETVFRGARRGETLELFFILSVYLIAYHNFRIRKTYALIGAFAFSVYSFAIGAVRRAGGILNVDLKTLTDQAKSLGNVQFTDVANGLFLVEWTWQNLRISHIFSVTDRIVERFVPGQLIGHDLKQALLLHQGPDWTLNAYRITGSTVTGVGSSFQSLLIFGFLWFALIALIMKNLSKNALQGSAISLCFFALMLRPSVSTIGFQHANFFVDFIFLMLFLWLPVRLFVSRKLVS